MRLFINLIALFAITVAVDAVWFDGYYSQTALRYINAQAQQIKGQFGSPDKSAFIQSPNLSRQWRIP